MAPAVTGAVAEEHWRQEGVTIAEVVAQLARLHSVVARSEAGDQEHPHPRSCVMNLVIVAEDGAGARFAAAAAAELSQRHPLRSVTLLARSGQAAARIDAELTTTTSEALFGRHVQCENITLSVTGSGGRHVRSLVEPLLAPDVGTYLWWMGSPPFSSEGFLDALAVTDVLVVDSARFERPFLALLELAQVAGAVGERLGLADLHWSRLRGWRELLAQFFSPDDRRPFLHGINGVGVDYVGEGRGNRVAAALLAGWLASSLGWTLKRATAGSGGVVVAYFEAERKHPVELAFRSVPRQGLAEGEVAAVRVQSVARGRTCALGIEREPEEPGRVAVHVEIGEHHGLDQVVAMPVAGEPDLLIELLSGARYDAVYLRALAAAGQLLRSLR